MITFNSLPVLVPRGKLLGRVVVPFLILLPGVMLADGSDLHQSSEQATLQTSQSRNAVHGTEAESGGRCVSEASGDGPMPGGFGIVDNPRTAMQLLQNLKSAFDHDLLLDKAFFDATPLLRFFNGSALRSEPPPLGVPGDTTVINIESKTPPIKVNVIWGSWKDGGFKTRTGKWVPEDARVSGTVFIDTQNVPGLTIRDVTAVFGKSGKLAPDTGMDTDGHSHVPTSKGTLSYETRNGRLCGGEAVSKKTAVFVIKLDSESERSPFPPSFRDADEIMSIELYELE